MLQKAISLNPDFDRAWVALGGVYEAQGKDQDAIQLYQEALKANPINNELRIRFGQLFISRKTSLPPSMSMR